MQEEFEGNSSFYTIAVKEWISALKLVCAGGLFRVGQEDKSFEYKVAWGLGKYWQGKGQSCSSSQKDSYRAWSAHTWPTVTFMVVGRDMI